MRGSTAVAGRRPTQGGPVWPAEGPSWPFVGPSAPILPCSLPISVPTSPWAIRLEPHDGAAPG